jgi:hypothetical protein
VKRYGGWVNGEWLAVKCYRVSAIHAPPRKEWEKQQILRSPPEPTPQS